MSITASRVPVNLLTASHSFVPCRPSFSGPGVSGCGAPSRGRSLSELLPSDVWQVLCLSHSSSGHLSAPGSVYQRTGEDGPRLLKKFETSTQIVVLWCLLLWFLFRLHIHIFGLSSEQRRGLEVCIKCALFPLWTWFIGQQQTLGGGHTHKVFSPCLSLYT